MTGTSAESTARPSRAGQASSVRWISTATPIPATSSATVTMLFDRVSIAIAATAADAISRRVVTPALSTVAATPMVSAVDSTARLSL
ncbi:hypothetical protein [Nakamurella aerolata]|uniref:Uncharacterized protein n=1 Tax=Nakamurella aerolata TaxID=1656892 RepID=A0A849ACQ6_9ACTN|nr:hypothetical protein [Nakamurella aerolata]NNG36270.1 hypothetical protein [Nakamurella aerolata]